jgi:uncharacterized protein YfaS (alpha-2-macroglobulin family)
MEYLHMQLPIAGIYNNVTMTGVPVKLCAIGSDGTTIDLGTTTTDAYYGTFSYTWTPDTPGTYTIIASFEGDDSYGSSCASTSLVVGAAAADTTAPTSTSNNFDEISNTLTTLTIGIGIAIIVAVAIVGLLVIRKK